MSRSGNKYLIYELIVTLLLLFVLNNSSVNGKKLIFCENCTIPRNVALDQHTTTVNVGNIFRAPSKCKEDEVLDQRNRCRRLVYGGN